MFLWISLVLSFTHHLFQFIFISSFRVQPTRSHMTMNGIRFAEMSTTNILKHTIIPPFDFNYTAIGKSDFDSWLMISFDIILQLWFGFKWLMVRIILYRQSTTVHSDDVYRIEVFFFGQIYYWFTRVRHVFRLCMPGHAAGIPFWGSNGILGGRTAYPQTLTWSPSEINMYLGMP